MKHPLTAGALVRGPDDGPASWAMGSLFERLAPSQETEGAFGLSLVTQPPGSATPLHVHTQEAEAFYVLEGTLTYRAGEESTGWRPALSSIFRGGCRTRSGSPARPRPGSSGWLSRGGYSVCTTR